MSTPTIGYGTINTDYVATWPTRVADDCRPMWALNLMRYRPVAAYGDDREPISGWAADDAYAPLKPLELVGAGPVLLAPVVHQLAGDDNRWDRIAIARYPSRMAMLEMQQLPEFLELHPHKEAGMQFSVIVATYPRYDVDPAPSGVPADRLLLELVADPETSVTGDVLGAEPLARFDVDGEIIGDGRPWREARWHRVTGSLSHRLLHHAPEVSKSRYTILMEPVLDLMTETLAGEAAMDARSPSANPRDECREGAT